MYMYMYVIKIYRHTCTCTHQNIYVRFILMEMGQQVKYPKPGISFLKGQGHFSWLKGTFKFQVWTWIYGICGAQTRATEASLYQLVPLQTCSHFGQPLLLRTRTLVNSYSCLFPNSYPCPKPTQSKSSYNKQSRCGLVGEHLSVKYDCWQSSPSSLVRKPRANQNGSAQTTPNRLPVVQLGHVIATLTRNMSGLRSLVECVCASSVVLRSDQTWTKVCDRLSLGFKMADCKKYQKFC